MTNKPEWVDQLNAEVARRPDSHPLDPEEPVTQIGSNGTFREVPRFEGCKPTEFDVSATLGEVTVEEAVRRAFRRPARRKDSARVLRSEHLIAAEYLPVLHQRRPNDKHVGIYAPVNHDKDPAGARAWWQNPLRVTLAEVAGL